MANQAILKRLDEILELELSGVSRYLHYSFMIRGPSRIPIVDFFRKEAMEALGHATQIGEKITSLGGHPSIKIQPVPETNKHGIDDILTESLEFEKHALNLHLFCDSLFKFFVQTFNDDESLCRRTRLPTIYKARRHTSFHRRFKFRIFENDIRITSPQL